MSDPRRGLMSASGTKAAAECTGKVAMENEVRARGKYFELPDSARDKGNKIHGALALEAKGENPSGDLTPDERVTKHHCAELRDIAVAGWDPELMAANNGEVETIIERRFWYRRGFFPLFSGQPDYVKINHAKRRAFIVNFKTGRLESEESADNLQLRTEVVLLKHNYPELEEISAAIIEPWVSWDSVQVHYAGEDLRQAENQIVAIADRTIWEADKRTAGPWCKHCKAKSYCNEAIAYAQTIPQFNRDQAFYELPRGEAGSRLWERIKVAKKLLEELEWAYTRVLEVEPDALPGFILPKVGKTRRQVPYPEKFKAKLNDLLTGSEIDGCSTIHLSKVEELLAIKHKLDSKEAKRLFQQLCQDVIVTLYDQPSIRPLTRKEREEKEKIKTSEAQFSPAELSPV